MRDEAVSIAERGFSACSAPQQRAQPTWAAVTRTIVLISDVESNLTSLTGDARAC